MRVEEGRTITAFEAPFLGDVVRHIIKEKEEKKRSGKLYTAAFVLLASAVLARVNLCPKW